MNDHIDQPRVDRERPLDGQDLPRPAAGCLDTRCVPARPHARAITRRALEIALRERDEAREAVRVLHALWNEARRAA